MYTLDQQYMANTLFLGLLVMMTYGVFASVTNTYISDQTILFTNTFTILAGIVFIGDVLGNRTQYSNVVLLLYIVSMCFAFTSLYYLRKSNDLRKQMLIAQ